MQHLYETVSHKREDGFPLRVYHVSGVYLHWHEEYEFLMVEGGRARCMINGMPVELQEGGVVLLPSGALHSVSGTPGATVTAIVASPSLWAGNGQEALFDGQISFQQVFDRKDPLSPSIISLLQSIIRMANASCLGYDFIIGAKFAEFFALLLQNERFSRSAQASKRVSREFKSMLAYIHTHYAEKITLATLSKISFYSATYIINLFKAYTNLTPMEYITQYRLSLAREMLLAGRERNSSIALSCGFCSESHLIQAFKKCYGMTPHAYRKQKAASVGTPAQGIAFDFLSNMYYNENDRLPAAGDAEGR